MTSETEKMYAALVQQQFIDAVKARVAETLNTKPYAKQITYLDPCLASDNFSSHVQVYHSAGPTLIPIEEYADYTNLVRGDLQDVQEVLLAMKTSVDQASECYVSLIDNLWRRGMHTSSTRLAITKFNAKFTVMFASPSSMDVDQTSRGWVAWRMRFAGTKLK